MGVGANLTVFAKTGRSDAGCAAAGTEADEVPALVASNGAGPGTGIGTLLSRNSDLDNGIATVAAVTTATSSGAAVAGVDVCTAPGRGGAVVGLGTAATRVGSGLTAVLMVAGLAVSGLADPHLCSTAANISVFPCSR